MGYDVRKSIVIVEDDRDFAEQMSNYLQGYGENVIVMYTMTDLLDLLREHRPRLILLDQFVHNSDAVSFISRIREIYQGGLVILTGNVEQSDRVVALELGADDFILKTTAPRELVARLRAVERRSMVQEPGLRPRAIEGTAWPVARPTSSDIITDRKASIMVDGWEIHIFRREIANNHGQSVRFTQMELALLMELIKASPEPGSREALTLA